MNCLRFATLLPPCTGTWQQADFSKNHSW